MAKRKKDKINPMTTPNYFLNIQMIFLIKLIDELEKQTLVEDEMDNVLDCVLGYD